MEVRLCLFITLGFWDLDNVYFNREGFDSHQGYYDDKGIYIPGPKWDPYNECYPDELNDDFDDMFDEDYNQGMRYIIIKSLIQKMMDMEIMQMMIYLMKRSM